MSLANLGDLRAEVSNYAIDTSTTFTNRFTTFLTLAEDRIFLGVDEPREQRSPPIRIRAMETEADIAVVNGIGPLPTDYLEARRLYWDTDPERELRYVSPRAFHTLPNRRFQIPSTNALPCDFTIEGNSLLVSPEASGTVKFWYFARPAVLVNDADTNVVLTAAPTLYLMATLIEAFDFKRDDAQMVKALGRYRSVANGLSMSERRGRYSGASLTPRIHGGIA